jgi:hypothetical protein
MKCNPNFTYLSEAGPACNIQNANGANAFYKFLLMLQSMQGQSAIVKTADMPVAMILGIPLCEPTFTCLLTG